MNFEFLTELKTLDNQTIRQQTLPLFPFSGTIKILLPGI